MLAMLQEWDAVFKRTQAGLAVASVAVEDIAEAASQALLTAARAPRALAPTVSFRSCRSTCPERIMPSDPSILCTVRGFAQKSIKL